MDTEILKTQLHESMEIMQLHFDVADHRLPLDDFIIAANSTKAIIEDFNQQFFGGKLKYQIVVLPSEIGSFREKLGIIVTTGAIFVLGGLVPEFSSGVIKGITGKSVAELGEIVGQKIDSEADSIQKIWHESLVAIFLREASKGFFLKEVDALEKCGITKEIFSKSYEGRNEFYESCYRNSEIQGVGFDDTDTFPIQRKDFAKFIVDIPEKEDNADSDWKVEITYIKVTSPNWERGDNRSWKAKYERDREAFFTIEDKIFWGLVEAEQLILKGKDSIKVQWAYIVENGKRKKFRVLKVLEYNGAEISDPLSDEELKDVLEKYSKTSKKQGDLFGA
jgi:hypothetical protein